MSAGLAKVLIVDDEQLVLDAMRRQHGRRFAVTCACSAQAALEIVRGHGPFAVVVSDYNMPHMDGVTFLARMRDLAPRTVRILFTGQADVGLAMQAVNRGAIFRFVSKPCTADEFAAIVQSAVDEHAALVAAHAQIVEPAPSGAGASGPRSP